MTTLGNIIGPELLIVLGIVALVFGSSRIPSLARSLGAARHEFERGRHEHGDADQDRHP